MLVATTECHLPFRALGSLNIGADQLFGCSPLLSNICYTTAVKAGDIGYYGDLIKDGLHSARSVGVFVNLLILQKEQNNTIRTNC